MSWPMLQAINIVESRFNHAIVLNFYLWGGAFDLEWALACTKGQTSLSILIPTNVAKNLANISLSLDYPSWILG